MAVDKWIPIVLGVTVVGVVIYLLTRTPQGVGERAYPPYQNQLETYNPSGYAEDQYWTFIPAGYPGYGMGLNMGVEEGGYPWVGDTLVF